MGIGVFDNIPSVRCFIKINGTKKYANFAIIPELFLMMKNV